MAGRSRRTIRIWPRSAGLSSFDQRHRFNGDFTYRAAVRRRTSAGSTRGLARGGRSATGSSTATCSWHRARRSPRACSAASPTSPAASTARCGPTTTASRSRSAIRRRRSSSTRGVFSIPAPGTFGNAGRNTIIGPGTSVMNLGLTQEHHASARPAVCRSRCWPATCSTPCSSRRSTPYVNSPTFGQVTSVRPMRRVQLLFRFRF